MTILELKNISKTHKNGTNKIKVLDSLNLKIKESGLYVITGKSGSGKSTLLQIISGIEKPNTGEIIIDGEDVSSISEDNFAKLRLKKIGIVFQFFNLLPALNILDNVAIPKQLAGFSKKESQKDALELLEKVQIASLANHFPHQVSGGEIQRAAIARSLINKPSFILADEPTGNLDPKTANKVIALFNELKLSEKVTFLVVTHSTDVVKYADESFNLSNGKLN